MRRNPKRDRTKRTTLSNPTRSGGHISAISRKQPRTISLLGSPSDKMGRPPLSPHPRPKNKARQRSPRSDRPPVFKRRSWPWSSTPPKAVLPPPSSFPPRARGRTAVPHVCMRACFYVYFLAAPPLKLSRHRRHVPAAQQPNSLAGAAHHPPQRPARPIANIRHQAQTTTRRRGTSPIGLA